VGGGGGGAPHPPAHGFLLDDRTMTQDPFPYVPDELKQQRIWMRWALKNGTKIPMQADGLTWAKSNDPATWTDYGTVCNAGRVAIALNEPYTGVDLDNCLDEQGQLRAWAVPIAERLSSVSYAEVSPSGQGVKFITRARKHPQAKCVHKIGSDKQQIECYDHARFWTVTGDVVRGAGTIRDGQAAIDWLCSQYLTPQHEPTPIPIPVGGMAGVLWGDLLTRAASYVDGIPGEVKGNLRNAAFRLAGNLHAFVGEAGERLSDDQVLDLLRSWNTRNTPPLRDTELQEATRNGRKNGTARADKLPQAIAVPDLSGVDLSAIIEPRPVIRPPSTDHKLPAELLEIPGLIGDVMRHNLETAHYPLPELALAGALALMSAITGGKVVDKVRTRTNLYLIGLAPSGGGKDHSRKLNRNILRAAGHGEVVGPERIGSHAGIISTMAEQWLTLFQLDEIGHLVMAMQHQGSPHLVQISAVLMQLFSSADSEWISDAYGDRSKVKRLLYPHAVLYGTSVPEGFWESLTEDNLKGGLIGRCLVFESRNYVDYQEPSEAEIPQGVIDRVRYWLDLQTHPGNLAGADGGAHPRRVDRDEAAHQRLHQHTLDISKRRMTEDPIRSAIWSRTAEKTNKLALLFACSRADEDWPTIRLEDADRAIRLNNWLTRRMLLAADRHVSGSDFGRMVNSMRALLAERPEQSWSLTAICRRTRKLTPRQRQDVLQTLMQSGDVVAETGQDGRGREVVLYRSTEDQSAE
jgi:hypothetical protein